MAQASGGTPQRNKALRRRHRVGYPRRPSHEMMLCANGQYAIRPLRPTRSPQLPRFQMSRLRKSVRPNGVALGAVVKAGSTVHGMRPAERTISRESKRPISSLVSGIVAIAPAPSASSISPSAQPARLIRNFAKGTTGAQAEIVMPLIRNMTRIAR